MTRLIDLPSSALPGLRGEELVRAIADSEGRAVAAETIVATGPLLDKVSNP
ncbi:MAG: PEP phosphonomutase family protein, partial [Actinomyces urogenitalis DORA_12]